MVVEARQIRLRSRSFERTSVPRRKRLNSQGTEMSVVFTGLVVCLMFLALLITARQAEVARVGYQIVSLRKDLASHQAEYQRLDVEVARLQALDRIEVAAQKLGMKRPTEVRLVYADEPAIARPAVPVTTAKTGLRQYLAQAAAAFARVASGVIGAEARTLK